MIAFPAAQYIATTLQMKIIEFLSEGGGTLIGSKKLKEIEEKLMRKEIEYIIIPDVSINTQIGEYVIQLSKDTNTPIIITKTIGGEEFNSYIDFTYYNIGLVIGSITTTNQSETQENPTINILTILLIIIILTLAVIATIESWIILGR